MRGFVKLSCFSRRSTPRSGWGIGQTVSDVVCLRCVAQVVQLRLFGISHLHLVD
jgi:hypothetical protein